MSLSEHDIAVPRDGHPDIPCSIWSATTDPRGVVLLGHGLGVDRYDATVRAPMEVLTREHEVAVVVPEIPLHGTRAEPSADPAGIVDRWQQFWASGGVRTICDELHHLVDFCTDRFGSRPLGYFGLSLATQYGLPFLAESAAVTAAVLGLFGSWPPPRTPIMNRYAPEVKCPVYFVQKLDDEIHPAESTTHLLSTLGARDKVLDATPGRHAAVSMDSVRNACAFLADRARFRAD